MISIKGLVIKTHSQLTHGKKCAEESKQAKCNSLFSYSEKGVERIIQFCVILSTFLEVEEEAIRDFLNFCLERHFKIE